MAGTCTGNVVYVLGHVLYTTIHITMLHMCRGSRAAVQGGANKHSQKPQRELSKLVYAKPHSTAWCMDPVVVHGMGSTEALF